MKKKIYTLALALLSLFCSVDAMAQTWEWTGETKPSTTAAETWYFIMHSNGMFLANKSNEMIQLDDVSDNDIFGIKYGTYRVGATSATEKTGYCIHQKNGNYLYVSNSNLYGGYFNLNYEKAIAYNFAEDSKNPGYYAINYDNKQWLYADSNNKISNNNSNAAKNSYPWRLISPAQKNAYELFASIGSEDFAKLSGSALIAQYFNINNNTYSYKSEINQNTFTSLKTQYISAYDQIYGKSEEAMDLLLKATDEQGIKDAINKLGVQATFTWTVPAESTPDQTYESPITSDNTDYANCPITVVSDKPEVANVVNGVLYVYRTNTTETVTFTVSQPAGSGYLANTQTYTLKVSVAENHLPYNNANGFTIDNNGSKTIAFVGIPKTIKFTTSTSSTSGTSWALYESEDGINFATTATWKSEDNDQTVTVDLKSSTKAVQFKYTGTRAWFVGTDGTISNISITAMDIDGTIAINKPEDTDIYTNDASITREYSFTQSNASGAISIESDNENVVATLNNSSIPTGFDVASTELFTIKLKDGVEYGDHEATITVKDEKNVKDELTVTIHHKQPVVSDAACESGIVTTGETVTLNGSFQHQNYVGENITVESDSEAFVVKFEQKNNNSFDGSATENFTVTFNAEEDGTYNGVITITAGSAVQTVKVSATRKTTHAVAAANTLKVGDANIATIYLPYNAAIPENAKAFTGVLDEANSTLILTKIENGAIPANTAVVVSVADDATASFGMTNDATATIEGNDLMGVLVSTPVSEVSEGVVVHTLGMGIESKTPGFYAFKGETLGAFKAYLPVPAKSAGKAFKMAFATPTGIKTIASEAVKDNAPIYNLSGQRVNASSKGIVIINGQKVLNK